MAIPILLSKRLSSIFNRILICLAAFDNIFIVCSLLEAIRKNFGPIHDRVHSYAFAYFLYQLQSVAIVSSIFTTIVLALERRLAVAKPIEYHNAVQVSKIQFGSDRGPVFLADFEIIPIEAVRGQIYGGMGAGVRERSPPVR